MNEWGEVAAVGLRFYCYYMACLGVSVQCCLIYAIINIFTHAANYAHLLLDHALQRFG